MTEQIPDVHTTTVMPTPDLVDLLKMMVVIKEQLDNKLTTIHNDQNQLDDKFTS